MSAWRTVRVFLSSTFRDMHAERDHLVKVAFPAQRLRQADGTVRTWRTSGSSHGPRLRGLEAALTGERVIKYFGGVPHLALSGDGRLLAAASADGRLRIWNPRTGRPRACLPADQEYPLPGAITDLRWLAGTVVLLTMSKDSSVQLWNCARARPFFGVNGAPRDDGGGVLA